MGVMVRRLIFLKKEMNLESGFRPNLVTVVSVLPICAGLEDGGHCETYSLSCCEDWFGFSHEYWQCDG